MEVRSDLKIISIIFRKAYFNPISPQAYFYLISRSVFQLYFALGIYRPYFVIYLTSIYTSSPEGP
jgi:hypothetical protein